MPGKAPRDKGNRFESAIVEKAKEFRIKAEKVPGSGSYGGSYLDDLTLKIMGAITRWECKWRGDGFKSLYKWIAGNHGVFIKADRCEPLVVLRADYFMQLIQAAGVGRWHVYPIEHSEDENDAE